ncbi:hypothetical protein ELY21_14980 [Legionella sp. km535]|uniref:hypothetical protein n=1 Tax=Legionella sp. km535 TaxID=2498107 RepID=UPI000F8E1524|nr:hypothetical protein [Legionella sp. km535]RUR15189.1 hypothetical protein ELY21_14980 [Legionella sp. km535]
MRVINKIYGEKSIRCTDKRSLVSEDNHRLMGSLTHSLTCLEEVAPASGSLSKDSISLKNAYGFCFNNFFQSNLIQTAAGSLTVIFAVRHDIHHQSLSNQLKSYLPGIHSLIDPAEFPVSSYFKIKLTAYDSRLFLHMECCAFVDLYHYDLINLLDLLNDHKNGEGSSDAQDKKPVEIIEQIVVPNTMHSAVKVRHIKTDKGIFITPLLNTIQSYALNCLNRFEELSINREAEAFQTARDLGVILKRIEKNYLSVTFDEYEMALTLLKTLEGNETYQMDPHIWLSMTKIRDALERLKDKALFVDKGMEVSQHQLDILMQELKLHEGVKPKSDIWFPLGTVDNLIQQLEVFYPDYTVSSTSLVI